MTGESMVGASATIILLTGMYAAAGEGALDKGMGLDASSTGEYSIGDATSISPKQLRALCALARSMGSFAPVIATASSNSLEEHLEKGRGSGGGEKGDGLLLDIIDVRSRDSTMAAPKKSSSGAREGEVGWSWAVGVKSSSGTKLLFPFSSDGKED